MSIVPIIYNHLSHFTEPGKVLLYLFSKQYLQLDTYTKGAIVKMIKNVDSNTSEYEKSIILEYLEKLVLFNISNKIKIVRKGEDIYIDLDLTNLPTQDEYSIQAYNSESRSPLNLSVEVISSNPFTIFFSDLELEENHTYKVDIVLQKGNDSVLLISEVYIILEHDINYVNDINPSTFTGISDTSGTVFVDSSNILFTARI